MLTTEQIFVCSDITFNENWEVIDNRPPSAEALGCLQTGCDHCIKNLMNDNYSMKVIWRATRFKFLKRFKDYILIGRIDKDQDNNDCLILSCAPKKDCDIEINKKLIPFTKG